ncbi:MAG: hypothetical protein ACFFG0_28725 [Candidatus Thorarchaeota archaeon]
MFSNNSNDDPLKTYNKIYDSLERYITAIYESSKMGHDPSTSILADYLKISTSSVHNFFRKWDAFTSKFINIIGGRGRKQSIYILTNKWKELVSLIYRFKNY